MSMYGVVDHTIACTTKGRAKQSMKAECDINVIMARYVETGLMSHLAAGVPSFPDVGDLPDYRGAIENMRAAEKYFMGLPAEVRASFDHDAGAFMDYLQSGASEKELRELSLKILGDQRGRSQDAREGDVEPPPAARPTEAADTVLT